MLNWQTWNGQSLNIILQQLKLFVKSLKTTVRKFSVHERSKVRSLLSISKIAPCLARSKSDFAIILVTSVHVRELYYFVMLRT